MKKTTIRRVFALVLTCIGLTPYDKPEVAVAAILEHGENSVFAQQVARDLLAAYFAEQKRSAQ